VSYNKADKATALDIATYLKVEDDLSVWFDEWEISAGDSIVEKINSGLRDCTHFIIVWSKHAATSHWVRKELAVILVRAIKLETPKVIPIVLDRTPVPELLADIKHIRWHDGFDDDRNALIRSITCHDPSQALAVAIVRKYHEIISDPDSSDDDPFGLKFCPKCGRDQLKRDSLVDYELDDVYYTITCENCGWSNFSE
jgi:TIR domain